jgi:hypothetical protein
MSNKKTIGVIVSGGYGAGWSTWGCPEMALDQELAQAIHNELPYEEIEQIAKRNWPNEYMGGLHQCHVEWLDEGTLFRIEEYDGSESLHFPDHYQWQVAK